MKIIRRFVDWNNSTYFFYEFDHVIRPFRIGRSVTWFIISHVLAHFSRFSDWMLMCGQFLAESIASLVSCTASGLILHKYSLQWKKTHKTILCGICSSFFCPVTEIVPSTLDLPFSPVFFFISSFSFIAFIFFLHLWFRSGSGSFCVYLFICVCYFYDRLAPVWSPIYLMSRVERER